MVRAIMNTRFMRNPIMCWYAICLMALLVIAVPILLLGYTETAWAVTNFGSMIVVAGFAAFALRDMRRRRLAGRKD